MFLRENYRIAKGHCHIYWGNQGIPVALHRKELAVVATGQRMGQQTRQGGRLDQAHQSL